MTDAEKLAMLEVLTGETDTTMLAVYLSVAANKVCRRAYPFDATVATVPDIYAINQVQIAAYLVQKRGAEGEIVHSENGVSRSYENGDVPPSLLRDIVPFASIVTLPVVEEEGVV